MDPTSFDALVRSYTQASSRRRVLAQLAVLLPAAGLGLRLEEEAEARRRRRRRQARHHPGKHKQNRKGKRKGNGKARDQGDNCLDAATDLQAAATTLQAAINNTPPGGTLTLCAGTFPAVNLQINNPITIVGQGANQTFLDAQLMDTAITFNMDSALRNLTVQNAPALRPALFLNNFTVTLSNVTISFNQGTGIFNQGDLTLNNVTVTTNQNIGIVNANSLTLNGTQVTNNNAAQRGGGLFNTMNGMAFVDANSTITGNFAGTAGGGIFLDTGTVTLRSANIVTGNTPTNCAPPNTINNCLN
jgi:hypothetical protein